MRKAQEKLNEDPDVAAEADLFLRQEAQHAAAHHKHMIALVQRYLPDWADTWMREYQRGSDMTAFYPTSER